MRKKSPEFASESLYVKPKLLSPKEIKRIGEVKFDEKQKVRLLGIVETLKRAMECLIESWFLIAFFKHSFRKK